LFQRWLEETSEILGLGPSIADKLQERYPIECFAAIPKYFWPKDRKKRKDMDKRVKWFEQVLTAEIVRASNPPLETTTYREEFLERWLNVDELSTEGLAGKILRGDFSYADVAWDLRKKMIEEAKASLQKEPKRSRTR
jgi:hypothetical protein